MARGVAVTAVIVALVVCLSGAAKQDVWLFTLVGDGHLRIPLIDIGIPVVGGFVEKSQQDTFLRNAEQLEKAMELHWSVDANCIHQVRAWEVSQSEYYDQLEEFAEKPDKDDILVFYYSGHGGVGRMGPVFSDGELTASYDGLAYSLHKTQAASTIFILDTCYAGSASDSGFAMPYNYWILASTCADWVTWNDIFIHKISPFTAALIESIRAGATGIREMYENAESAPVWGFLSKLQPCPPIMYFPSTYATQDLIIQGAIGQFVVSPYDYLIRSLASWGNVTDLAFSPDSTLLAAAGVNATLWDVATGQTLHTFSGSGGFVRCVAFSPDGKLLVSGLADSIKVWDVTTGSLMRTLTGHTTMVKCIAFSPDGALLASGSLRTVKLWDTATWQELRPLTLPSAIWVNCISFGPDTYISSSDRTSFYKLALGADDGRISVWHVPQGAPIYSIQGHVGSVRSVTFSPDGRTLASGSDDETIKLWDVASGNEIRTLTGHTDGVNSVAFSPSGTILASAGEDMTVRLWNPATGTLLRTMTEHTAIVPSLAFSPDGTLLASGDHDFRILLHGDR